MSTIENMANHVRELEALYARCGVEERIKGNLVPAMSEAGQERIRLRLEEAKGHLQQLRATV